MKNLKVVIVLVASHLFVSGVAAQTVAARIQDRPTANETSDRDAIAAARIPYIQTEDVSQDAKLQYPKAHDTKDADAAEHETLAQFSRRGPGHPYPHGYPRRGGYPRGGRPAMWQQPEFNRRHAAIGAVIGFALGAAIGAKVNTDQHVQARVGAPLIVGSIGALLGAVVGGTAPPGPGWSFHRRRPLRDEEQDEVGSSSKRHPADREASSPLAPAKPVAKQDTASIESPESSVGPEITEMTEAENRNASEPHLNK